MATIEKRKGRSGTSYRIISYNGGVRRTKTISPKDGKTFAEVKRMAAQIDAGDIFVARRVVSLLGLMTEYMRRRQHEVKPFTIERGMIAMRELCKFIDSLVAIQTIDYNRIHEFRDWLLDRRTTLSEYDDEQRARRGVNKELRELRVIFNWAYQNDFMDKKIFDRVTLLKAGHRLPETYTRDEQIRLYKHLTRAPVDFRLAWWILRFSGVRRSELLSLDWSDINGSHILVQHTKNGQERRVPMHDKLARVLRWTRKAGSIINVSARSLTNEFGRASNRAGIKKKRMPIHAFRHTAGARIIEAEMNDGGQRMAQETLGHLTNVMTKHYTQIAIENLQKKLNEIDL